ncbi:uncharacterized protein MELLADRAFT_96255 [Melampsora larici-populina 98AG31]|uniref:Uncharacterized protein n=1 Tax=Melampsora larici-populina (strain 98AG31 / pathotype 3-4-7) TaxID=747676 RepID=F4RE42_MELLP|nr:uncharacterized protein MELLADRAFT_96255 [Melampsora larici-populina 98AG31]EGG09339.1 hypothetical protein MELLADRAFT_96255 [Melampsora larici-populina 98AG31]
MPRTRINFVLHLDFHLHRLHPQRFSPYQPTICLILLSMLPYWILERSSGVFNYTITNSSVKPIKSDEGDLELLAKKRQNSDAQAAFCLCRQTYIKNTVTELQHEVKEMFMHQETHSLSILNQSDPNQPTTSSTNNPVSTTTNTATTTNSGNPNNTNTTSTIANHSILKFAPPTPNTSEPESNEWVFCFIVPLIRCWGFVLPKPPTSLFLSGFKKIFEEFSFSSSPISPSTESWFTP